MSNETVVDRVVARLKTQPLGDLITEEDLHEIVKSAIPKTFFEERRENVGTGSYPRWERREPLLIEIMRGLLKESARDAVGKWMIENQELLAANLKNAVDTGLVQYVRAIEDERTNGQMRRGLAAIFQEVNNERMKAGLSSIPFSF